MEDKYSKFKKKINEFEKQIKEPNRHQILDEGQNFLSSLKFFNLNFDAQKLSPDKRQSSIVKTDLILKEKEETIVIIDH